MSSGTATTHRQSELLKSGPEKIPSKLLYIDILQCRFRQEVVQSHNIAAAYLPTSHIVADVASPICYRHQKDRTFIERSDLKGPQRSNR